MPDPRLTAAEHAVGVALLRRAGVPALVAEVEMVLDPTCQHVARELTPVMAQLAKSVTRVLAALRATGGRP